MQREWDEFVKTTYTNLDNPEQIRHLQYAFFCGGLIFATVLKLTTEDRIPEELAVELMGKIGDDWMAWAMVEPPVVRVGKITEALR